MKCETCNQTFESYQLLNGHKLNNASCTLRKFKCDACGKSFKEKVALKRHMTSHTDETPYPCKLCGKKFKFPQNLRRHDNIVHKELKPFKCDICGKGKHYFLYNQFYELWIFKVVMHNFFLQTKKPLLLNLSNWAKFALIEKLYAKILKVHHFNNS